MVEIHKRHLQLVRDSSRIYLEGKDKRDPHVAVIRNKIAEDIRYFHGKWLTAKHNG